MFSLTRVGVSPRTLYKSGDGRRVAKELIQKGLRSTSITLDEFHMGMKSVAAAGDHSIDMNGTFSCS